MTDGHDHDHRNQDGASDRHDHRHDDGHGHGGHDHPRGVRGIVASVFSPHGHDVGESVDAALEASDEGMRALKISLVALAVTAGLQVAAVTVSGSVALLADTVHNFADALTAVPLAFALWVGPRPATERHTYGYGRAEVLAGVFVVATIALSAGVAAWEAVQRLLHPRSVRNVGWVLAAEHRSSTGGPSRASGADGRSGPHASTPRRAAPPSR